uniref:Uncharacterized protein n=1 Tax=Arundo donax TaxID=35708 RepID=A0A0A9ASI5_ARUDO
MLERPCSFFLVLPAHIQKRTGTTNLIEGQVRTSGCVGVGA